MKIAKTIANLLTFLSISFNAFSIESIDTLLNNSDYSLYKLDLDKNGKMDFIFSEATPDGDNLFIFMNGEDSAYLGSNFNIEVQRMLTNIESPNKNQIKITSSFPSSGELYSIYHIEKRHKDWILTSYEVISEAFMESYKKQRTICKFDIDTSLKEISTNLNLINLYPLSTNDPHFYSQCNEEMQLFLTPEELLRNIENKKYLLTNKEEYIQLVKQNPIKNSNVELYNNIAFYLGNAGYHKGAVTLLELILSHYPNRVVAYLNIADNQFSIGKKKDAQINYQKYYDHMISDNKENKIPKRVYKRI